jgi:peptidoglycan/xylan/chitin deacetylase (PgdA/CDA1 family)
MSSYSQLFGRYLWRFRVKEKVIALTFDDGPNEPYTSELLKILDHYQIKATFFMVGNCVARYPETAKKVLSEGHTIGNHSLSHKFGNYFKKDFFETEISKNQDIIKKYLKIEPILYRSPWLWRSPKLLNRLQANGLIVISGKFCNSLEVFKISSKLIARSVVRKSRPGSVIIFHDGKEGGTGDRSNTIEAVDIVIKKLLEKGYRFKTIDKLLNISAYKSSR